MFWYGIETLPPYAIDLHEELIDADFVITENLEKMKNLLTNNFYFGVKKGENGWVVSEVTKHLEYQTLISESDAEMAKQSKHIFHERVPDSKLDEVYGDDSDIGF